MRWLPVDTDAHPFLIYCGSRVVFHEGHMHLCWTHTHGSSAPLPPTNRTPMLLGLPLIEGLIFIVLLPCYHRCHLVAHFVGNGRFVMLGVRSVSGRVPTCMAGS